MQTKILDLEREREREQRNSPVEDEAKSERV